VPLFPSIPKGEIFDMFYKQRMIYIGGKYNSNNGLSTDKMCQASTRSILGRCSRESSKILDEIVQRFIQSVCLSLMARSCRKEKR